MRSLQLKLYVTGRSRRIDLAISHLRLALDKEVSGDYDLCTEIASGIAGFSAISHGGLPKGRTRQRR